MIEAACAIDLLLWPSDGAKGIPLAEVARITQGLHEAVLKLKQSRRPPVSEIEYG